MAEWKEGTRLGPWHCPWATGADARASASGEPAMKQQVPSSLTYLHSETTAMILPQEEKAPVEAGRFHVPLLPSQAKGNWEPCWPFTQRAGRLTVLLYQKEWAYFIARSHKSEFWVLYHCSKRIFFHVLL